MSASRNHTELHLSGGRKWLAFFVLVFVIPAAFFLLFEGVLRLVGYGYSTDFFVERQLDGKTVFSENPKFSRRFFPESLARPASHVTISADKAPNTFRIFVLGGSAAMGDPDFSFGFSRMLGKMLRHQFPERQFEVFNVAVTAINSHVILPIARDCAKLQPDLFIIYLGNNEVIGPYGPGTVFAPFSASLGFIRASIFVNTLKTAQLVNNLKHRVAANPNDRQVWNGVDMFLENRLRFDDPPMTHVYDHFQQNLKDICKVAEDANARVLLSTVSTNVKDCAPFGSLHSSKISQDELDEWTEVYDSGIALEAAGKFSDALAAYGKAAEIDNEFADLHFRRAQCFLALGEFDNAKKQFEQARDYDALRFRADTKINAAIKTIGLETESEQVTLADASEVLRQEATAQIPGEALFYDHVHFNPEGNFQLAAVMLEKVALILNLQVNKPALTQAECMNEVALTSWDRYRMEHEILERMKSPAFANQLNNQETLSRWQARLDGRAGSLQPKALADAIRVYETAIQRDENDWVVRNNFGLLLLETQVNPVQAEQQFRHILRLFPDDHLAYNNLGLALAQQNKLNEAVANYEQALHLKPDFSKANFNLAEVLERHGKYPEALDFYHKADLPNEGLAAAYNRIGLRLANADRRDEALRHFEQALALSPEFVDAHINMGKLLAQSGAAEEAAYHYTEAVNLNPDLIEPRIDLASLYFAQQDYKSAAAQYRQVLETRTDLPEVQNNLGLTLCNLGQFEQAIPHFKAARALKPGDAAAQNNLAGALSRLGRSEEAIAELQKSLKINPNSPNAHNNIGAELLRMGKTEQAIGHFRKALEIDPNSVSAQSNLKHALARLQNNDG